MRKILLLATIILVTSCASKRDIIYFQNIDDLDMGSLKKDVNEIKNINLE